MMSISRMMAWSTWVVASIFYAYQYVLRVMPNVMLNDIMHHFQIDAALFGQFSGIYYIGYAALHLPIGIMLDRFGPKIVMPICVLLTSIGLIPLTVNTDWSFALGGRALIGIGSSAAILGLFKIIRMTFDSKQFARMLSFSVMIGLIGAIYGGKPVYQMCQHLTAQGVVKIFIAISIFLSIAMYFIIPPVKETPRKSIMGDFKTILKQPRILSICMFAGLFVGPLEGFADVWGSEFLKQVYGFSPDVASYLPSMIFIGMCFGSPVLTFIAEKSKSTLSVIIISGVIMMIIFTALVFGLLTLTTIPIGFVFVGICCAYQILAIYLASTYVLERMSGMTTAIANMIIMSFGYAFHTGIGLIIQLASPHNPRQAFIYGIGSIPVMLGIGIIGFLRLKNSLKKKAFISQNVPL